MTSAHDTFAAAISGHITGRSSLAVGCWSEALPVAGRLRVRVLIAQCRVEAMSNDTVATPTATDLDHHGVLIMSSPLSRLNQGPADAISPDLTERRGPMRRHRRRTQRSDGWAIVRRASRGNHADDPGGWPAEIARASQIVGRGSRLFGGGGTVFERITTDPAVMAGVPCIRGLRVPVATVVGMVAEGMTADEIIDDFPYLEREDIAEALRYAAEAVRERQLPLVADG